MAGADLGYSFAFKAIGNFIGSNKSAAAAYKQQTAGLQQEAAAWERNGEENQAIAESNLTNQIRTGYKVGMLNVQRAQAKKRAMQDGFDLSKQGQQALASATANAAAAGTIGSSVDAVVNDINSSIDSVAIQLGENNEQTMDNFDTQLTDLLNQGHDVLRSSSKANITHTADPGSSGGFLDSIVGAAIDVGGSYLSQKMTLGLGKKSGV